MRVKKGERGQGTLVTQRDIDDFIESLTLTEEEYQKASACKQRTPEWYAYRYGRLSASNFGAAAGHNAYHADGHGKLLKTMLWPRSSRDRDDKARANMAYGTVMEKHGIKIARLSVVSHYQSLGYEQVWIDDTGTMICREHPWLSVSSDGLIYAVGAQGSGLEPMRGTLEHKCRTSGAVYDAAPHHYNDQFQGAGALLKVDEIAFSSYGVVRTAVLYYRFDPAYWAVLFGKLQGFYMTQFVWRAILKARGLIAPGCVDPHSLTTLTIHYTDESEEASDGLLRGGGSADDRRGGEADGPTEGEGAERLAKVRRVEQSGTKASLRPFQPTKRPVHEGVRGFRHMANPCGSSRSGAILVLPAALAQGAAMGLRGRSSGTGHSRDPKRVPSVRPSLCKALSREEAGGGGRGEGI